MPALVEVFVVEVNLGGETVIMHEPSMDARIPEFTTDTSRQIAKRHKDTQTRNDVSTFEIL